MSRTIASAGRLTSATIFLLTASASAIAQPERVIRLDDDAAAARLSDMRASWSTRDEWLERAASVRRHVMRTLDIPAFDVERATLTPDSARGPLHSQVGEARGHDGYVVENVSFESFPGTRVSGNLYRPADATRRHPAILCPHGHFRATDDDPEGRFRRDMQIRCATLARMGAVVFAYDMVGWGESDISDHDVSPALPLQTYNSIRVVDYLVSRDDVDETRLGITGASGGGSQTFLLTALDDRIDASVPVVMVSSHFFGGCNCETGLPIHTGEDFVTNNVEIAALAAPRPQLVISCGEDWTSHTPEIEFPAIAEVYATLGAPDAINNAHFADEGHDYGASKRVPMYEFFAACFGLDISSVRTPEGDIDESPVTIEPRDDLLCCAPEASPPKRTAAEAIKDLRSAPSP
jgi:hypothetical protein